MGEETPIWDNGSWEMERLVHTPESQQ